MRIAVSSSSFRRPLASGRLTQLEWVERCASALNVDGVLADIADFPRTDVEYVAQLRKVAIDLGLVAFGVDAPGLLAPGMPAAERDAALAVAREFGASIVRTALPPPGEVPPASFVEAVAVAKAASKAAKAANVTLVVPPQAGTLGPDLGEVRHLLKDVDSAWLRACPPASADPAAFGPKERFPAFSFAAGDDPSGVSEAARRGWILLAVPAGEAPWEEVGAVAATLRAGVR
ncbi:hypothetical protein WPS_34530 [Vulcanimicrobium alpinum]|uniref:Xylose isomerase-like TIM barrel domain-containing protein n=1 Tax=Vulcanimicrobium alpinum TaxID=3016050 RepID=A0AAN1XZC5_UNVUL|nr:hypothetical protein [Vulcanimicrobium alpinum]BDE08177.1 hypothetical protein WPS_34530 [Vulcanimicrobium alpinum]